MALAAYRSVLSTPGIIPLLALGFFARLPFSTLALLLTLHTVLTLERSYLAAGLVVTASTLGVALSAPWRGRLVDRKGLRRAVAPSIVLQSAALAAAAYMPYAGLIALAFVGGLFALPIWSVVRTSLSVMVPAARRRSAFALDAVSTELVFMVAPALMTIAVFAIGSRPTMLIVAALVAAAGIGIFWMNPPTRSEQMMLPTKMPPMLQAMEDASLAQQSQLQEKRGSEDTTTGALPVIDPDDPAAQAAKDTARQRLLTLGGLAVLVGTVAGSQLLTGSEVALVAMLQEFGAPGWLALVLAIYCAGSAIGGLAYGAITREINPLWVVLVFGLLAAPVALAPNAVWVCVAVFFTGLACAPMITATGEALANRVPEEIRGEAMGWHGSAMTIGGAMAGPVIGVVIDRAGGSAGMAVAGTIAGVVALGGLAATSIHRRRVRARLRARFSG
ncbi:MAG: MFS transporter [Brachybacterium sp.]|nr:MFS transporter [Brachybacterium sp.]